MTVWYVSSSSKYDMKNEDSSTVGTKLCAGTGHGLGRPKESCQSGVSAQLNVSCAAPGALDWNALTTSTLPILTSCQTLVPILIGFAAVSTAFMSMPSYGV